MDFNVPNHFIDLGAVKTENIDFEEESDKLRNILDFAQKENDVQQYIKQNKNGLSLLHYLGTMTLVITQRTLYQSNLLVRSIKQTTCY